jgi:hypothetical protein
MYVRWQELEFATEDEVVTSKVNVGSTPVATVQQLLEHS